LDKLTNKNFTDQIKQNLEKLTDKNFIDKLVTNLVNFYTQLTQKLTTFIE